MVTSHSTDSYPAALNGPLGGGLPPTAMGTNPDDKAGALRDPCTRTTHRRALAAPANCPAPQDIIARSRAQDR